MIKVSLGSHTVLEMSELNVTSPVWLRASGLTSSNACTSLAIWVPQ